MSREVNPAMTLSHSARRVSGGSPRHLYHLLFIICYLAQGALLLGQGALLTACSHPKPYQHNEGMVFGTVYNITYQSNENLQEEIEAALSVVDQEFSMFNDSSTVARINRGETPELSPMYQEVYQLAQYVNRETDGAFDITVAPLVNAWGFGFKHSDMPTQEQVDSLLKIRDMLDFSAIAKGYGCDVVARLLNSHGIKNLMVEIGGEVVVRGENPDGQAWRVGVTKPIKDSLSLDTPIQAVLNITECGMATSGNYRNFYYKGGKKYAHTIDPKTGYPVQHSLLSATVLSKNCATADAYATSFMVMGVERAKAVLERHPELMAYFIYANPDGTNGVWFSPSLKEKIEN
jgi:thiamine biosynthesis lipoprotein